MSDLKLFVVNGSCGDGHFVVAESPDRAVDELRRANVDMSDPDEFDQTDVVEMSMDRPLKIDTNGGGVVEKLVCDWVVTNGRGFLASENY